MTRNAPARLWFALDRNIVRKSQMIGFGPDSLRIGGKHRLASELGDAMIDSLWMFDALARETMLFASIGLLIGGIDDLLIDVVFLGRIVWRGRSPRLTLAALPTPRTAGRITVFVAAWDEEPVIGRMIATALERFDHPDYRIYVGLYPNDQGTIRAASAAAGNDPRVRLVVGARNGPTTKADCLNTLWHALRRHDADEGCTTKAIVLHDAEDVVHPQELRVFDALIDTCSVVQIPVLPLIKRGSLVSGHYADEFAEAHAKQLVVRTALGAGMPLAGTGCAITPGILGVVAHARGGDPFDATSLTEDYELGLRIAELGALGIFARVDDGHGGIVAVRAFFPSKIMAAVRQKARWMTGIALAGWDRTGWGRPLAVMDHWMRMRDRRAPLSVLILADAYVALLAWGMNTVVHWRTDSVVPDDASPATWLLWINTALLGWRLGMRMVFTGQTYGVREALWSLPRFLVGNVVSLIAAPLAVMKYVGMLRGAAPVWDKTRHEFPDLIEEPIDPMARPISTT